MTYSSRSAVVVLALIAVIAMAPVAPEVGNVIFIAMGVASIALLFQRGTEQLRRPIVWMPLTALLLIAIAYVMGAGSLEGLIGLAFFAPMFAVWPLVSAGDELRFEDNAALLGMLGLAGVAGAAVVAVLEVVSTGTTRAGASVANPIHFADVALLVGFLSCAGVMARAGKWRFVFFLGPVLATIAVALSGTRGAAVAIVAMVTIAGLGLLVLRLVSLRRAAFCVLVLLATAFLAHTMGASRISGVERVIADFAEVIETGFPTDNSTSTRFDMLRGGGQAFLQAPIFGHGPIAFVNVANELSGAEPSNWPHLHNDVMDFAASAGLFGIFAFALLLLAPILEVVRGQEHESRRQTLVLVGALVTGFFVMGLTNAMFGILNLTTTYAAICVATGLLVQRRRA